MVHINRLPARQPTTARPQGRLRRARPLLALLATVVLAACGGGGGGEPEPTLPAIVANAPDWGNDPLPGGAQQVSPEELARIAADTDNARFTTADAIRTADARAQSQAAADRSFLQQRAATDPAVAALLAAADAGDRTGSARRLADGSYELTLDDGRKVVTEPATALISEWADLLRNADLRDNLERRYRSYSAALADDELPALGLPADPAALDLPALKAALGRLAGRVVENVPKVSPPASLPLAAERRFALGASAAEAGAGGPGASMFALGSDRARALAATACSDAHMPVRSPVVDLDFPLKAHLQTARDQGERPTCTGMATTAAIELLAGRQYGRQVNLSEQHLWGMYKGFWAPGGGGSQYAIYQQALTGQYGNVSTTPVPLRPEAQWTYNTGKTCSGYSGPCSETNHQMPLKFTPVGGKTKLTLQSPIDNKAGGERYTLERYSFIPGDDRAAMVEQIKAELSLGRPVGVAFQVSDCVDNIPWRAFVNMQLPGTNGCDLDDSRGSHSVLAVGWVSDDELEALFDDNAPPRDGGGYFILRNSWGCNWGDRGYFYVSFQWARNYLSGGRVFESAMAQFPAAVLKVGSSKLGAPGPVTLTALTNSLVKRVAFLHGSPTRGLRDAGTDTGAPFSATVQLLEADRGANTFIAVGYDENNNPVVTNTVQTVLASPGDPTISLGAPAVVDRNAEFKLTANVFDDSGIDRVTLRENGVVKVVRLGPPWEFKRTQATAGAFTYTATVRSKDGVEVTSAPRTVTVRPDDPPVVGSFTASPFVVRDTGSDVTLTWTSSGADVVQLVSSQGTQDVAASGSAVLPSFQGFECVQLRASNARGLTIKSACIGRTPRVNAFTVTPASLPAGGGTVTLSWVLADDTPPAWGTVDKLTISPAVGQIPNQTVNGVSRAPLTGSVTVNVTQSTIFSLVASNTAWSADTSRQATVTVAAPDTTPPSVSLASSASSVTSAQTITLSAQASDDIGVAKVEFFRGVSKIGEDTSAPYTFDVPLTAADNGSLSFTARALDAAGNQATSAAVTVSVNIVVPDTTPPTVALNASPTAVTAPGSTTLTANASDNVGVAKVEFYEGATKIGEALAAPYAFTRNYAANESGSFSYVAVATDTSGNATTSVARVVNVTAASSADRYVAPTGSDANPGTPAQPYLTLTKALAQVGSGGTVWVAPGTYTWAGEVAAGAPPLDGRTVPMPAGITLRASTPGSATLNFGLRPAGSATVIGLHLTTVNGDTAFGYGTGFVLPNGGTVTLKGVSFGRWQQAFAYCNGCGGATLAIDDNGSAGFNYVGSDYTGTFLDLGSGTVAINGGRLAGPTLASTGETCNSGMLMSINGSAQVTLTNVTVELGAVTGGISSHPIGFCVANKSGATTARLSLVNSSVTQLGAGSRYRIVALAGPGQLSMQGSTMSGPSFGQIGTTGNAVQVTLAGSTLAGGTEGIVNNAGEYSEPTVTLTSSVLQGFAANAIHLPHGGSLSVTGGQIASNGSAGIRLGGVAIPGFQSGVYALTLRGATIQGNGNAAGDGAGVVLAGAAGSTFDLGTATTPGGNQLLGLSASKPALRTGANAAVTVNAVGNTWTASQQGASASGQYTGNLLVTSGSGQNYSVTSGGLRLAGN